MKVWFVKKNYLINTETKSRELHALVRFLSKPEIYLFHLHCRLSRSRLSITGMVKKNFPPKIPSLLFPHRNGQPKASSLILAPTSMPKSKSYMRARPLLQPSMLWNWQTLMSKLLLWKQYWPSQQIHPNPKP